MAEASPTYSVFTFVSTHHALKAEKLLKQEAIKATIIPVPRQISSLCGLAIRVTPELRSQVEEVLRSQGVGIEEIVDLNTSRR